MSLPPSKLVFLLKGKAAFGYAADAGILALSFSEAASSTAVSPDVSSREEHTYTAEVTEHPVKDGASFSDHILIKPFTLSVEAMINEDSLALEYTSANLTLEGTGISAFLKKKVPLIGGTLSNISLPLVPSSALGGFVVTPPDPLSQTRAKKLIGRHIKAFKVIKQIFQDRTPITVVTGLDRYENMVMHRLSVPRDAETAASVRFRAEFKQIITGSVLVSPQVAPPFRESASPKVAKGAVTPTPATPPQPTQAQSILNEIFGDAP